jgi:hypothetical protein
VEKTPYTTYVDYVAMKRHFSDDSYDYFKYHGKVNIKFSTYDKRSDKYYFEKLSKLENSKEILLSFLSKNPDTWIGDIVDDLSKYKEWKKVISSLEYTFTEDIKKLDYSDFESNFRVTNGEYPPLLQLFQKDKIHKETLIILNTLFKFMGHWNKNIDDSLVWPSIYFNLKKYSAFINIDRYKYMELFKRQFDTLKN